VVAYVLNDNLVIVAVMLAVIVTIATVAVIVTVAVGCGCCCDCDCGHGCGCTRQVGRALLSACCSLAVGVATTLHFHEREELQLP
jgi:hypothetical protein